MTERKINRGSEIRAKGKSMGRERSGVSADPSDRPSPQAGGLKAASSAEGVRGGLSSSVESAEGSPAAPAERSMTLRAALFLTGRIALISMLPVRLALIRQPAFWSAQRSLSRQSRL